MQKTLLIIWGLLVRLQVCAISFFVVSWNACGLELAAVGDLIAAVTHVMYYYYYYKGGRALSKTIVLYRIGMHYSSEHAVQVNGA